MTTPEELRRQARNHWRATGRQPVTASGEIGGRQVACTLTQRGTSPVAYLWRVDGLPSSARAVTVLAS